MLQVFLFMIKFILIFDHFVVVPVFNYLFTYLFQREFFYFSLKETRLELQTPVWSTVKILMVEQWKKQVK